MPLVIAAKMSEPHEVRYFEQEVEPLLGPDDQVVGEVGGERKQALLHRAAALLNPLRWHEPFGLVMVEALAVGTPVVATPKGAAPEIVEDGTTGFLRAGDEAARHRTPEGDVAGARGVPRLGSSTLQHRADGRRPPPLLRAGRDAQGRGGRMTSPWVFAEEAQSIPAEAVTLVCGTTFAILDAAGNLAAHGPQGLFVADTRSAPGPA